MGEVLAVARIRTIKPEFWTDEKIVTLTPLARLLFIGLWNFVDDEGRAAYSPTRFKMQILPADAADISELLGELRRELLIEVYSVDGKEYVQCVNFSKHQKVDHRSPSKHPSPPNFTEASKKNPLEGKGKDQGKEGKGACETRAREAFQISEDWKPDDACVSKAKALGLTDTDIANMVDRFVPYSRGKGTVSEDWCATFQSWLPGEAKKLGRKPPQESDRAALKAVRKATVRVQQDTPQWEAWRKHLGKSPPADSNFGWYFDSEWPPGHEPEEQAA